MSIRRLLFLILAAVAVYGCGSGSNHSPIAEPVETPTNDDGSPITGSMTAEFDPTAGVLPFPNNLLFQGTEDLTVNIPVDDPTDFGDPQVALNALDGFSTVAPWSTTFGEPIAAGSVNPGASVRVFEVGLREFGGPVTEVIRELEPGVDFTATLAGSDPNDTTLAIVPLRPLEQLTTYMAVITDDVRSQTGNDAIPSQVYFLTKRQSPLVDAEGNSTDPLVSDSDAQALEPLRQLVNSQEDAAVAQGIARDDIVLSWTMTTQSITPALSAVRSTIQPAEHETVRIGPTSFVGLEGLADIHLGRLEVPYYLEAPTEEDPDAILTGFWEAEPGNYVPPFDDPELGLDPESTNITFANPLPQVRSMQDIPVGLTVPNDDSGHSKPEAGWPVVVFLHDITADRTSAIALADTLAQQGIAGVGIDLPLHGVTDTESIAFAGNDPFEETQERTFNVDLVNNETGAPGPDGNIDSSGTHFINLQSLLTSRDNLRQAVSDAMVLAATLPNIDIDGDGLGDFDGSRIHFVGHGLGAMVGTAVLAIEATADQPNVRVATLSAPGAGIAQFLAGSPTFGPPIREGLRQAAGIEPGSPDFAAFLGAAQTVVDSADPINFARLASAASPVLVHEIVGGPSSPPDQVAPNQVEGAPLSGTEALIRIMGLQPLTSSVEDPAGVRRATRFIAGDHSSLLLPEASQAVTVEMQTQMASMIASGGTAVQVANPDVIAAE